MKTLEDINKKLDMLIAKVEMLEKALELEGSPLFSAMLKTVRLETSLASRVLSGYDAMERYKVFTKDDISLAILRALDRHGVLNILQLTEKVRILRGKSSRRIIRKKLEELAQRDIVVEVSDKKGRGFSLKKNDLDSRGK